MMTIDVLNYVEKRPLDLTETKTYTHFREQIQELYPLTEDFDKNEIYYYPSRGKSAKIDSDEAFNTFLAFIETRKETKQKTFCYLKNPDIDNKILTPETDDEKQIVKLTEDFSSIITMESENTLEEAKNEYISRIKDTIPSLELLLSQTMEKATRTAFDSFLSIIPIDDDNIQTHNASCSICKLGPIKGFIINCSQCREFKVCSNCEILFRKDNYFHEKKHTLYRTQDTRLIHKGTKTQEKTVNEEIKFQLGKKNIIDGENYKVETKNYIEENWNYAEKENFKDKAIKICYKNVGTEPLPSTMQFDILFSNSKKGIMPTFSQSIKGEKKVNEEFSFDVKPDSSLLEKGVGSYYMITGLRTNNKAFLKSSIVKIRINFNAAISQYNE